MIKETHFFLYYLIDEGSEKQYSQTHYQLEKRRDKALAQHLEKVRLIHDLGSKPAGNG